MRIITLLLSLFLVSTTYANTAEVISNCPSSQPRWDTDLPPLNIVKSNSLRRKTGSADFAEGNFIDIEGKILDSRCVPISEAVVEIWHADADGISIEGDKPGQDSGFAYSGTAITDNLGRFTFFTISPGTTPNKRPYINFRIKHTDFMPFESKVYFFNNTLTNCSNRTKKNLDNRKTNLLSLTKIGTTGNSVVYNLILTLEGVNKYKRY